MKPGLRPLAEHPSPCLIAAPGCLGPGGRETVGKAGVQSQGAKQATQHLEAANIDSQGPWATW